MISFSILDLNLLSFCCRLSSALRSCFGLVYKRECGEVIADILDNYYLEYFTSPHLMFYDLYDDGHYPYVPYCNGRNYHKDWSDAQYNAHFSKYSDSFLAKPITRSNGEHVHREYFAKAALHGPFHYDPTADKGFAFSSENQSVSGTDVSRTHRTERGSEAPSTTGEFNTTAGEANTTSRETHTTGHFSNGAGLKSHACWSSLLYLVIVLVLSQWR